MNLGFANTELGFVRQRGIIGSYNAVAAWIPHCRTKLIAPCRCTNNHASKPLDALVAITRSSAYGSVEVYQTPVCQRDHGRSGEGLGY